MRKVLTLGGALLFGAGFYIRLAARAGFAGRAILGLVFGGFLVAAAALGSGSPPRAAAELPPTLDVAAVSAMISPVRTGWGVTQPIVVRFSAPMDTASVSAAISVTPQAQVKLEWDATASQLYVEPVVGWTAGTVYTVSVGPGARAQDGAALSPMAPAIVYVRAPGSVTLQATKLVGERLALDSAFLMTFSRPVDLGALRDALTISPAVSGTLAFEGSPGEQPSVVWVPDAPLLPDTTYTVALGPSAVDLDGAPLRDPPTLTLRTISRPSVVRFRPLDKATGIATTQVLSVRFSEAMDHPSTEAAYHLYELGTDGKRSEVDLSKAQRSWAENDTVLVIDPPKPLDAGHAYVTEIAASARSQLGAAISENVDKVASATFTVASAPTATKTTTTTTPKPTGGGTSTAPWLANEQYYLGLLNCTHTGGWLHSDGSCTGRGSNGVPALILDSTLSTCASRPWAKYLADTNQLYHGDVGGRFAACGYNVYWGENVTWYTGDVNAGAIASVIFFQNEKGTADDGHYLNLMNTRFTHVGIGIWRENGKNWYVVDFWGH